MNETFPAGLPTAIYFTGCTCASCLPKAAVLDRFERESDGKLAVLGVDVDGFDTEEMFRDWIAHAGSPRHAFAMDRDFELLERFNVVALSTVVVTAAKCEPKMPRTIVDSSSSEGCVV